MKVQATPPDRPVFLNPSSLFVVLMMVLGGWLSEITLRAVEPANLTSHNTNTPTLITAGPEWVPLRDQLDIEPGSALDFSGIGGTDSPAGKHGRVLARPDGQFAFADSLEQA